MRDDLIDRNGFTIQQAIESRPYIAEDEFDTLAWIVYGGTNSFGLEGEELVEFARRCIHALLDAGAKPFVNASFQTPEFHPTGQWGTGRDEITENIIADWQAQGGGELEWGEYPFAFVEHYYPDGWPPTDDG